MLPLLFTLLLLLPALFALAGIALARGPRLLAQAGETATLTAEQVTELGARTKDLAQSCLAAVTKVTDLRSTPADKRGETFTADLRSAIDELTANDAMHAAVTRILREDAAEQERNRPGGEGRGPHAATSQLDDGVDRRSAGQQVAEHEAYRAFAERGGRGSAEVEVRALLSTSSGDGQAAGLFMPRGTPFLLPAGVDRRRLFARDMLSTGTTGLNSVPYIRELDPRGTEGGATAVAEGAPKPEVTMQFQPADAPVRKIAAWIPVTTEILADAPTLRSYIDARLGYLLLVREEDQVLNGNGTNPNLRGIRNTTGLQTLAGPVGDNLTALAQAIRNIELVDGEPDGVAINPTDFWALITRRAGDGHYDLDPFMDPARMQPWGLPPVRTRGMPAGTALVGNWKIGATLLDREETVIRVGEQHADFFTNNKVAILAEERIALPVHRPDFFVEVAFG
jgi:HK97 family phage major capsid protein